MQNGPRADQSSLNGNDLNLVDRYWRAANYLSVGQIYLLDNPLLREPPRPGLPSFPSIAAKESLTSDMIASFLLLPHAAMPSPPLSRKDAQDIVAFIMKTKK
jgi:hypothetical protein